MLSTSILNIFAKSPIRPMQKHMLKILDCTLKLQPFFTAALQLDWELAEHEYQLILQYESEADELKKGIRLHLPTSLLMPVARSDLLGLLTSQDKIASKVKHIAGLIIGRKMSFPESIQAQLQLFIQRCIHTAEVAQQAINALDDLVETGFKGKEVTAVENIINQLDATERETDSMQVELRKDLFAMEQELNPIDAIFLYKIIDWIGELADRSQHVGHRLESLLAR